MLSGTFVVTLYPASADAPPVPPVTEEAGGNSFTASFRPGQSIAQAVYLSGLFQPPVLCSGLARCGRCRMLIETNAPEPLPADRQFFSPEDLALGWRLACRHKPREGMRLRLPKGTVPFAVAYGLRGVMKKSKDAPAGHKYVLALDLGTTTLQWRLVEVQAGEKEGAVASDAKVLWEGSAVNPQMGAGSEVVSRLAVAMKEGGRERLRALAMESIRALLEASLAFIPKGSGQKITSLCLAANPAMTCLALGHDTSGLANAPYSLPLTGGSWEKLPAFPPLWLPPQLSPFVGGDISAGYAFLALNPELPAPFYPFLLADLGTNGEFLLALSPEKAYVASVALGPALEGTGLSRGTEARPGAIASFILSAKGLGARPLPGLPPGRDISAACPGITGTGYISLLTILLRAGVLARDGSFRPEFSGPLHRFFRFSQRAATGEQRLELPLGLRLPASDVEELLKVKAAFSLGLQRLLDTAGLRTDRIGRIYLAGALGMHVDKAGLEELGFFPQGMATRVEAVGNSSLAGAALLLQYPAVRDALVEWSGKVESLELARDAAFLQEFPNHMQFGWRK